VIRHVALGFLLLLLSSGRSAASATSAAELANPYKGWKVARLELRGLDQDLAEKLRPGLALAPRRGFSRRRTELYPNTLEQDIARVQLWLARQGYPEAVVQPILEPRGGEVIVVFAVEMGPVRRLRDVEILGWPAAVPRPTPPKALRPGSRFADGPAADWARQLQKDLRASGYAFATARARATGTDASASTLSIEILLGQRYVVGEIRVRGCREDLKPLALKTIGLHAGDWFSPLALEDAELSLRLLDLFRQIKLGVEPAGEGRLAITADLVERSPRNIEAGAGYWTDEFFRVHVIWRHRNLFRRGRGAQLGGSWSIHLHELNATTWWPGRPVPNSRIQLGTSLEDQIEESYDLLLLRSSVGVRFRHSLVTTSQVALQYENADLELKTEETGAFDARGGTLLSLVASWARDAADDRLDPSSGSVLQARAEGTLPGQPSEVHFLALEGSATGYLSLFPRWVNASRVTLGWATPLEDSEDLLPNKRFYAGGASSMRGFARRRLGPVDDKEAPLGGEAKLELSSELRVPLFWKLRGAIFVDAGQVWSRPEMLKLGQLEVAAGPGLMFATPLGPVRADIGFRLTNQDRRAGDFTAHLTIGHPY
jgi:outer membrane protein assembly factor BamA